MAKTIEEVIESMQEDRKKFQDFIDETKKKKIKMLNPKVSAKVMASAGVIAYIDTKLKEFNL